MNIPAPWQRFSHSGPVCTFSSPGTPDKRLDLSNIFGVTHRVDDVEILSAPITLVVSVSRAAQAVAANINLANDYVQVNNGLTHDYVAGDRVRCYSSGTLPTGLSADTDYYVAPYTTSNSTLRFRIFTTYADAIAYTNPINLTDQGTGTHTFYTYEDEQTITATPTVQSFEDGVVVYTWSWTGVRVSAFGTITVEYDGSMRHDFTVRRSVRSHVRTLRLECPIDPGVCVFLERQPVPSATEFNAAEMPYSHAWASSSDFPRLIRVHDRRYGFEWAMETDKDFASQGTAKATIDVSDSTITIAPVNFLWPPVIGTYTGTYGTFDLTYRWYITDAPTKNIPGSQLIPRFGTTGTGSAGQFQPRAEECPSSPYRYQGGGVPISMSTWNSYRTAANADGRKILVYLALWNLPEDDNWQPEWENPEGGDFTGSQYKLDCNTDNPQYVFQGIDLRVESCRTYKLTQVDTVLEYSDGIYYDVQNSPRLPATNDNAGVGRYFYDIYYSRLHQRDIALKIQAQGKWSVGHAQGNIGLAHGDTVFDFTVPGENYRDDIAAVVSNQSRFLWYTTGLEYYIRMSEWAPQVFGMGTALIPQFPLADYTNGERLATENFIGISFIHGVSWWQSLTNGTVTHEIWEALEAFSPDDTTEFLDWYSNEHPLATEETDILFGTLRKANGQFFTLIFSTAPTNTTHNFTVRDTPVTSLTRSSRGTGASPLLSRAAYESDLTYNSETKVFTVGIPSYSFVTLTGTLLTPTTEPVALLGGEQRPIDLGTQDMPRIERTKDNELLPIVCRLRHNDTLNPIDLTGYSIKFRCTKDDETVVINNRTATILDITTGLVSFQPQAGDFSEAGIYWGWFIYSSGGLDERVPRGRKFKIVVIRDE